MKTRSLIYLLLVTTATCFGQNGTSDYRFWNQESLSGALSLKGNYRNQHRTLGLGVEETLKGSLISGGFLLESQSFIIHPSLMNLGIEIEYNPEKMDRQFSTIPDRSDVRTLKRLNVRTDFFNGKVITLNTFFNLNEGFINRENLSNSKTKRQFWGAGLFYKNKILPLSVTYSEGKRTQEEIEVGREYTYWQRSIKSQMSKSFFTNDRNRLSYSYDDYINEESFSSTLRQNKVHYIILNSSLFFDPLQKYNLTTIVSNLNQKGTDDLNRFQINGSLYMKLPQNFKLNGNYNYRDTRNPFYELSQNSLRLGLSHQLFKSLTTNIYAEYAYNKHSIYIENDIKAGFDIYYTKKIPLGRMNITYAYSQRNFNRDGESVPMKIIGEKHILTDEEIVLLDEPFADIETIVVKDVTGTIVYDLNIDYLLFARNDFIEIVRIPGGLIPNNSEVFVDYSRMLSGAYKFNSINHIFAINFLLFNNFLELYYRREQQDYSNIETVDLVALNYYLRNLYGVKFNIGIGRVGVEYESLKSSIIPYELLRVFINLNWRLNSKILFSLVGNTRYYISIGDRVGELYIDVSGRLAYRFNSRMKLNMILGYRDQKGYEIELEYLTAKTELTWIIRKIDITAGFDIYRRNYLNREIIDFNGAYINIIRKF